MAKILVIIHERNHVYRLLSKATEHMKNDDVTIVTIGVSLPDTELICRDFRDYMPRLYEEIAMRKAQSWIKNWSNEKIIEGKTFKELISYDGVSLWWFLEFYYFYTLYVSHIARSIEILKAVMLKEEPTKVIFIKDGSLFSRVLEIFAKVNNIETLEIPQKFSIRKRIKRHFTNFLRTQARRKWKTFLTIKETLRSKWINLLNMVLSKGLRKTNGLSTVVVITPERFWLSVIDSRTGKTRKGFVLTDSIIKKLADQHRLLLVTVDPFFDKIIGLKILLEEKRAYPNVIIRTPESWENKIVRDKVEDAKEKLDDVWKVLSESKDFQSSLNYDGIPLWSILREAFSGIFLMALPEAVRWIETMKAMIDKEKPLALVLPGEYCSFLGSAAIIAGKKRGVSTIAILHGVVTKNSLEYMITPNEKGEDANSKLWVIPTKLAVYGQYTKHALQALRYPSENIAITGHPDYDVLFGLERLLDKEEILRELRINSHERKIITFTTQALWSMKSRENLLRAVLEATKKLQNVILLIKPHPGENEDWHKKIVKEMGVRNAIVLDRHYSTAKALFVCDLMITSSSTTAMEAMALDKPVITINLEGKTEYYPYAKSGAAIGVFNPEYLLPTIEDVLQNENLRRKLAKRRQKFLSEHICKTDGRSSERIVNLISDIVQGGSAASD